MRIVLVSDTFRPTMGGIETQVGALADHLHARGHDIVVLTCTPEGDSPSTCPYSVLRSSWRNPFNAPIDPKAPRRFTDFIRRFNPDVVHYHMGELTPVVQSVLLNLKDSRIPQVVTVHSLWDPRVTIPAFRAIARRAGLVQAPIMWTGVSELVNEQIRQVLGSDICVSTLHNGVDVAPWQRPPVAHQGIVVVTATRFAPRKRVDALIDILSETRRRWDSYSRGHAGDFPLRAVVAGEGPLFDGVQRRVERAGLGDWLLLPGRLSATQLQDLYSRSDIFLAPSVKESASIAGREALASGLAVMTRSQSGLAEVVENGLNGWCLDNDDEMIEALLTVLEAPAQLERIHEHNRSEDFPFTWEKVIEATENYYRRAQELASTGA